MYKRSMVISLISSNYSSYENAETGFQTITTIQYYQILSDNIIKSINEKEMRARPMNVFEFMFEKKKKIFLNQKSQNKCKLFNVWSSIQMCSLCFDRDKGSYQSQNLMRIRKNTQTKCSFSNDSNFWFVQCRFRLHRFWFQNDLLNPCIVHVYTFYQWQIFHMVIMMVVVVVAMIEAKRNILVAVAACFAFA